MMSNKRVLKELKELKEVAPDEVVSIELVDDCLTNWNVTFMGPKDSPYEGGQFVFNINFGDKYPFEAPKFQFKTKIFHPSVQ